jgi:Inner membrane component of T3SS, periplasmic domain/Inner membrane component of T3SS, cytoplasmic domain
MSDKPSPASNALNRPWLVIVDGFHKGVRIDLDEGVYILGSSAEADIILRDPEVQPHHAVIRLDCGKLSIEAIGGDIRVGGKAVAVDQGCRPRLPADIEIGGARLRLFREPTRTIDPRLGLLITQLSSRPMLTAAAVMGCALAVIVASHLQTSDDNRSKLAMANDAAPSEKAPEPKPEVATPEVKPEADTPEAVARSLEEKLREARIDTIKVSSEGRRIAMSGRLSERRATEWTAIQRWFDETYASKYTLTVTVVIGQASVPPALKLQAIWYGDRPYIVTGNGTRYYEGSILESGWILQNISEENLVLKRDDETLALSYR